MRITAGAAIAAIAAAATITALRGADRLVVGIIVLGGLWLLGAYLWWTDSERGKSWGDLGRGIMIGVIMAFAIGIVQREVNNRLDARERQQTFELSIGSRSDLSGIDLSGRRLNGFYLARKKLKNADLRGTHLAGANLFRADLSRADLSEADLTDANLHDANLSGADLSGARLAGADLTSAKMIGARMPDVNLRQATMSGADLTDACMAPADLRDASLAGADLTRAVLTKADLRGTSFEFDLRNANLTSTGLAAVKTDRRTHWPRDYDTDIGLREPNPFAATGPTPDLALPATAGSVIDGDTIEISGPGPTRLIGVNAPELATRAGKDARQFARNLLPRGTEIAYEFGSKRRDRFDRNLLYVWLPDGRMLNEVLLEHGKAQRLEDPDNGKYELVMRTAETRAKRAGIGIWQQCPAT